jgi:hypothetical protein
MRTASIIRAMEAVRTSETSVHSKQTTRSYIPEDSKLHTRRRENLKSQTGSALAVLLTFGGKTIVAVKELRIFGTPMHIIVCAGLTSTIFRLRTASTRASYSSFLLEGLTQTLSSIRTYNRLHTGP